MLRGRLTRLHRRFECTRPSAGGPSGGSPGRPRGRPVTINGSPGPPGGAERSPQSHFGAILPICSSSARLEAKPTEVRRSHSKSVNIDLSSSDPGHSRAPRSLPIGSGLSRAVLDSSEALPVIRDHAAQKSCRRLRAPAPCAPRDRIALRGRANRTGVSQDDVPVDSDASQPKSSTWSARSDGSIGLEALPEAAARS